MFTVTIENSFNASHQLTLSDGQREPLHDHRWLIRATVEADELDETGMVIDFHYLKASLNKITQPLQDQVLGELSCFKEINVSAENVAKYIYDEMQVLLPSSVRLCSIDAAETPGCWAKFYT